VKQIDTMRPYTAHTTTDRPDVASHTKFLSGPPNLQMLPPHNYVQNAIIVLTIMRRPYHAIFVPIWLSKATSPF